MPAARAVPNPAWYGWRDSATSGSDNRTVRQSTTSSESPVRVRSTALAQPDVKQRFADLGMSGEDSTPDGLDVYIKAEIAKWTKVIKDADIRAVE